MNLLEKLSENRSYTSVAREYCVSVSTVIHFFTGKSTIAQVIDYVTCNGNMGDFTPYKYKCENPIEEEHAPYAELSNAVTKVAIHNELLGVIVLEYLA